MANSYDTTALTTRAAHRVMDGLPRLNEREWREGLADAGIPDDRIDTALHEMLISMTPGLDMIEMLAATGLTGEQLREAVQLTSSAWTDDGLGELRMSASILDENGKPTGDSFSVTRKIDRD